MMDARMAGAVPGVPRAGGAPDPVMSLISSLAGTGMDSPEQMNRYIQLATRMMASSYQNQTISAFWPEIRTLMLQDVAIPDQTHLGDMMHIIASNYSFQDFMNAIQNHLLFDILYRPMRERFTASVFNNQVPNQAQIQSAVDQIIAQDRNLIIAAFDVRQDEDLDVDENGTIVAIVREFVHTVFRELYNPGRGDIAAGFGDAFGRATLRLVGLVVAYCRHVNPEDPRNRITNQMSGFLRAIVPYQNISRDELYDNYIVRRVQEDTEDEEFVDAEEGEREAAQPAEEEKEEETVVEEENRPSPSGMVIDDELPDDVIVTTPTPAAVVTNGTPNGTHAPAPTVEMPSEWKRVIEEDVGKMESATYQPLSDGYRTSLPAKRRKTETKRSDNPDDVLQDLLVNSIPKPESGTLTRDPELGAMFRAKLKEDLKKKLKDSEDVNDQQFPSASKLKNSNS